MKFLLLLAAALGLLSLASQTAASAATAACTPRVSAHRGDSGHHVQGTLQAYASAYGEGARILDGDVRFTKSDVPMIMHDATLVVFGSKRAIADSSYRYVKSRKAPDGTSPMSLFDYVHMMKSYPDANAELEVKVPPDPRGWARIDRRLAAIKDRVRLSSFHKPIVIAAQKHSYKTGIITDTRLPTTDQVKRYGGEVYLSFALMTDEYVQSVQAAGFKVAVWTVNDPSQWATLPPKVIAITDDPGDYITWYQQNVCEQPST